MTIGTGSKSGLTARAGRNLVVHGGVTIPTNNGTINFTADSDKNGTGFLTLSLGSDIATKGAGVNLTGDHGSAAITGGMTLLGDIDTHTSVTGFGAASTFQVLGASADQNGVITVGSLGVTWTTLLNTGVVTTSGGQNYGRKVTMDHDTQLSSTVALNGGAAGGNAQAIDTSGVTQWGGGISVGSFATDAAGDVLQPLALRPPVVVPREVIDSVTHLPIPVETLATPNEGFRFTQFDLMNGSVGYREETMERPDGVWVIRSLGVNSRRDTLTQLLSGQRNARKAFVEL